MTCYGCGQQHPVTTYQEATTPRVHRLCELLRDRKPARPIPEHRDGALLDTKLDIGGPDQSVGEYAGKSFTDVPAWSASFRQAIDVSVDDPTFANPVPARLTGTTWSVAVPTPAVGSHTVYARATQGFDTGDAAARSFTVTK